MKNIPILKYKSYPTKPLITHCSYCFRELEQYKNKIKSFSHQEYNKPPYITNNWLFRSHYCRAKINMNDENYDLALQDIEKALELSPDDEGIAELKKECLRKIKEK